MKRLKKSRVFARGCLADEIFRPTWGGCRGEEDRDWGLGAPEGVKGETGRGKGGVTRINSSVAASLNLLCLASAKFVQAHSSMFINRGVVFPLFAGMEILPRFTRFK